MFKRIVPLVAVLALLLPCLLIPASAVASGYLDYNDYVTDITVDGDNDLVTFRMPLTFLVFDLVDYSSGEVVYSGNYSGAFEWVTDSEDVGNFYILRVSATKQPISFENIPDQTILKLTYCLEYLFEGRYSPFLTSGWLQYYGGNPPVAGTEDIYPNDEVDEYESGMVLSTEFVLIKDSSYSGFTYGVQAEITPFDADMYVRFEVMTLEMQMSLSNLVENPEDNSEILDSIEKHLQANGEKLDDIMNRPAQPKPPAGSGVVGDLDSKEDQLFADSEVGRDEAFDIISSSIGFINLFAPSFAFLSACLNPLFDIPYLSEILVISLGLGITGFILNLGFSSISKLSGSSGKGGKSGKGG